MWRREDITQAVVRELLDYDPATGFFTWRWRGRKWFAGEHDQRAFNGKYAGKRALASVGTLGHLEGQIFGIDVAAARVAFLWMTGRWPGKVGHENRVKADNRWCNLREASHSQTMIHSGLRSHNTSGVTGVQPYGENGKYRATLAGRHLGVFETMEAAVAARKKAEHDCWVDDRRTVKRRARSVPSQQARQ